MTGQILTQASREWATRPEDERFADLDSLAARVRADRDASEELRPFDRRLMQVSAVPGESAGDLGELEWNGCAFTNWSFNQTCQLAKAPASFLAELPAVNAAADLNYKLSRVPEFGEAGKRNLVAPLVRQLSDGSLRLRAATTEIYRRVWNADLVSGLCRMRDAGWVVPPAWDRKPAGLYYGDRSLFVFMVEDADRSIVTHPSSSSREDLGRGIMLWNSEEGCTSFGMLCFWFRFVCGNHLVWGAEGVREIRMRHVGEIRRRIDGAVSTALRLASADASNDLLGIRHAMGDRLLEGYYPSDKRLTEDLAPILARESKGKIGPRLAAAGVRQALKDGEDPKTRWGIVQGLTALARDSRNADGRRDLERVAVTLMPRAKKVGGEVVWAVA